jgi:predicted lipid-binding transport protein (Tim44 family)
MPGGRPMAGRRYGVSAATARRRQAQKRRRDVLFTLLAGMIGSLLLGLIPGLSMMLYVCGGFVLLFLGYVALLIRLRTLATEREMKLTFLPGPAPARTGFASAAERPRAAGDGYTLPAGYGAASDILMRRPAN